MIIDQIHTDAMSARRITTRAQIYDKYPVGRYITDLYREKYHTTIWGTVQAAVMSHARHLMYETDMRVGEVSDSLGYMNIHTFSEAYKNYFGESPLQARKRHKLIEK
jgi:two-component system response regulator YesN